MTDNLFLNKTYANRTNIGNLDAKSGNFRPLNPLNPPYQGDFKKGMRKSY